MSLGVPFSHVFDALTMKVAAFSVELQSSHRFAQSLETSERLEVWRGTRDAVPVTAGAQRPAVEISAAGLRESHPHDIVMTTEAPNYTGFHN